MSVMICCVMNTTALIKCAHMRTVKQTGWTRLNNPQIREETDKPLASHVRQAVFSCPFSCQPPKKAGIININKEGSVPA